MKMEPVPGCSSPRKYVQLREICVVCEPLNKWGNLKEFE